MTRRPNKPHKEGFADEEDCEGHYDPDEAERRKCHPHWQRGTNDPCWICFEAWYTEEKRKRQAIKDARTPEERAEHEVFLKGLRDLY